MLLDLLLGRAVEHRRRERHAAVQVARQLDRLRRRSSDSRSSRACRSSCRSSSRNLRSSATLACALQHLADRWPEALRGPAQVRLEDLADVHPRRHAQRIQHDVDRRAVGHVRHVFDRHDLRDHALVAVAAGHLVARLQAALDRDVHLDHLLHARRQLVALRELLLLLLERLVELDRASARAIPCSCSELLADLVVRQADVEPVDGARRRPGTPW